MKQKPDDPPALSKTFVIVCRFYSGCLVASGLWLALAGTKTSMAWPLLLLGSTLFVVGESESLARLWLRFWNSEESSNSDEVLNASGVSGLAARMKRKSDLLEEQKKATHDARRLMIVLALLGAFGIGFLAGRGGEGSDRSVRDATTVRLCEELQGCLTKLTENSSPKSGAGPAVLAIDPELRQALLDFLKSAPAARQDTLSGRSLLIMQILLLVFVAGALVWLLRKHPSAAPAVGAAALAAAVIANPDKFSRVDSSMYWMLCRLYGWSTAAGFAIIFALLVRHLVKDRFGTRSSTAEAKTNSPRPEKKEGNSSGDKMVDALLAAAFSLVVLVWAVVMVAFHTEPDKPNVLPKPVASQRQIERLSAEPKFVKSEPKPLGNAEVDELGKQLRREAKPGDRLLLLGSADCTPFRAGKNPIDRKKAETKNDELATQRAEKIEAMLASSLKDDRIEVIARALPQHTGCKEAADLRAVYSFLIPPNALDR